MVVKHLFLLSLLMASAGLLEAAAWCGPSCVLATVSGEKVAVPWDCTKYAVCIDLHGNGDLWPSEPTSCPDNQYFDATGPTPECEDIQGANTGFCANTCSPCEVLWAGIGNTTPDPDDCNTYLVGVAGDNTLTTHCDEDGFPYYDYVTGACSADETVCFNFCDHCEPYCTRNGNTWDPLDCEYFYYCSPPEITHVRCPVGEYFDEASSGCLADAACVTC